LTGRPITRSNVRLFRFEAAHDETHLPTIRRQAQADARLSRPDEERRGPQSSFRAPREGSRTSRALTPDRAHRQLGQPRRGARVRRLTGVGAFDGLFRTGRRHEGHYLQIVSAPAQHDVGRAGFVIGRKALPLAVDRNRLRRLLRVELARVRPAIEAYDVIVRLTRACARSELRAVADEAERLLRPLARAGATSIESP